MPAKEPDRFHAITNGGGWGASPDFAAAIAKAVKGSWMTKGKLADKLEVNVWELDNDKWPCTHIADADGHALHIPEGSKPNPHTGRHDGQTYAYKRTADEKDIVKPRHFVYKKGAQSDAGRHWEEVPNP